MRTQPCSIDPQLIPATRSPQAKKPASRTPKFAVAQVARIEALHKYRTKNEEDLREKARIRMAQRRAAIKEAGTVSEGQAAAVKKANETYRTKRREFLAFKQRLRRQEAFLAKHGQQAMLQRLARERAKADAAEDAIWQAQVEAERAQAAVERAARRNASTSGMGTSI